MWGSMRIEEDLLPQRQRLPVALRRSVGNDAKLRASFPVYATTLDGQVQPEPLPLANKLAYLARKERKQEAKAKPRARRSELGAQLECHAAGSRRRRAKMRKNSSSGGTLSPIVPTVPVSQGAYHMWSIHDPPATPTVLVDQHPSTAHTSAVPTHSSYPPPTPAGVHEQHAGSVPYSGGHVRLHFPYAATVPGPESISAAGNAYAAHSPPTTPDLETDHGSHSTAASSSRPPAVWTANPGVSGAPSSAHILSDPNPAFSDAHGSGWSTDRFNAVYQDFFVRRSFDTRDSSSPALARGPIEYYPEVLGQANGRPASQAYSITSTLTDNTVAPAGHGAAEQYPRDVCQGSDAAYATQPEDGNSIASSAPPAVAAPIDRQGWEDIEMAANAGYAYTQILQVLFPSPVPEAAYAAMHPSPPILSSYSELAHALQCPPRAFADDSAPSSMHGSATTLRPVVSSAETRTAVYTDPSRDASGIDSVGQVSLALTCLEDMPISEDECARIIQECFDASDHLLSQISSLRLSLGADFAYNVNQQLLATLKW